MPTPGTVLLSSLRLQAQQRADMVGGTFVTDAEWNQYIANSYKELYDLLVAAFGNDYFATTANISTDGTTYLFPLPDGTLYSSASAFYKLLGVDLMIQSSSNSYVTIRPFMFADRNRYSVGNSPSYAGDSNLRYRLNGSNLWMTPTPSSGQTLRLWYIPQPATLSADSDTIDGMSGWEEYIIIDAATKALVKEESDVSILLAEKEGIKRRIEAMADTRDAANPSTVSDTQGSTPWNRSGYGRYP